MPTYPFFPEETERTTRLLKWMKKKPERRQLFRQLRAEITSKHPRPIKCGSGNKTYVRMLTYSDEQFDILAAEECWRRLHDDDDDTD